MVVPIVEILDSVLAIVISGLTILGVIWAALTYYRKKREKFLYFSSCHLINLDLKKDLDLKEHAFAPIIVVPKKTRDYLGVKNNSSVDLEFAKPGGSDKMIVTATIYSYPENEKWKYYTEPAVSLVLRRYFGIERPVLGADMEIPDGWQKVEHGIKGLAKLHRITKGDKLIWMAKKEYSVRFWTVKKGVKQYSNKWTEGSVLEYSGLALKIRCRSWFRFSE